jgi:predicted transcriptional regulator
MPTPPSPLHQLAGQLKARRRVLRITQRELAQRADTSQAVIARLERAQLNPSLGLIQRVSTALETQFILAVYPEPAPEGPTPEWLEV